MWRVGKNTKQKQNSWFSQVAGFFTSVPHNCRKLGYLGIFIFAVRFPKKETCKTGTLGSFFKYLKRAGYFSGWFSFPNNTKHHFAHATSYYPTASTRWDFQLKHAKRQPTTTSKSSCKRIRSNFLIGVRQGAADFAGVSCANRLCLNFQKTHFLIVHKSCRVKVFQTAITQTRFWIICSSGVNTVLGTNTRTLTVRARVRLLHSFLGRSLLSHLLSLSPPTSSNGSLPFRWLRAEQYKQYTAHLNAAFFIFFSLVYCRVDFLRALDITAVLSVKDSCSYTGAVSEYVGISLITPPPLSSSQLSLLFQVRSIQYWFSSCPLVWLWWHCPDEKVWKMFWFYWWGGEKGGDESERQNTVEEAGRN